MMTSYEAFSRIQSVRRPCGPRVGGPVKCHQAARRRAPEAGCVESQSARPETETNDRHAFRFGPRNKRPLIGFRFFAVLAGDFGPRQALADDLTNGHIKALAICNHFAVSVLARVKPERLFVNVAEEMERFHGHIGAVNPALQQTPKVLKPIGVNVAVHIGFQVVHDLVFVLVGHSPRGAEFVGMNLAYRGQPEP